MEHKGYFPAAASLPPRCFAMQNGAVTALSRQGKLMRSAQRNARFQPISRRCRRDGGAHDACALARAWCERSSAGYIGAEPLCTFSLVRFFDVCQRNEHKNQLPLEVFVRTTLIPPNSVLLIRQPTSGCHLLRRRRLPVEHRLHPLHAKKSKKFSSPSCKNQNFVIKYIL